MRGFRIVAGLLAASSSLLLAQKKEAAPSSTAEVAQLQGVLAGSWAGTLEYRDFSEPATSTKRVKLPTWLSIELTGPGLRFHYIYDDGPNKTVTETSLARIDSATARYSIMDPAGKVTESYAIAGLAQLREGRGNLTLTGTGTEDDAAVEVRTTMRVGRNILEITRETAVPGQPYTFRHAYTLVRATPPAVTPGK